VEKLLYCRPLAYQILENQQFRAYAKGLRIVKQKAKVIGIVITSCPCCGNPINFDRQMTKVCAYCEEVVHIDLDKVEVSLHGPTAENKRVKISMN